MLIAVTGIIFITSLIFFFWLFEVLFVRERFIERIEQLDPNKKVIDEKILTQKKRKSMLAGIVKLIPQRRGGKMPQKLIRANLAFSSEELMIYKLLFSSALGFLIFALMSDYFIAIIVVVVVWLIPNLWINKRIKSRLDDYNAQLNGALVLIANALKAGHSFMQAISIAARETQGTFSDEFKILLKELNFGIPLDVGFRNLLNRVDSADMKLVVNAILIQKDIGGNLAEILENISGTIRERQMIKNELKTLTAQGRMSGIVVMMMPVFLGLIFYLFNKDYILLLFETNIGRGMLGLCVVNEIIGATLIRKIIKIEM